MLVLSRDPLSRWGQRLRGVALLLASSPLIGAYLYNQGYRLPFLTCPLRHFTGIPCPTCGMTRSFMAIARRDWQQAIEHHLFGPLLFIAFLIAVLHFSLELWHDRPIKRAFYLDWLRCKWVRTSLAIAYGVYYILRLMAWTHSGELSVAMARSPLGHWLLSAFCIG